jgi:excisionase family DNA binding protein
MTTLTAPRLLRASEVARMLGVTTATLRQLVASGELRSVRLGGSGWHRFRVEDVEALMRGDSP